MNQRTIIDGNEAAADVAYRLSELCSIYPITPSSTMAELADEWSSHGRKNVFGTVPTVVEMQSEGGAAGAMHGALQGGALSTTFTASQGLLLMIPNMYRIAGELTSTVFHVAARSLAAQGLSIFGDHQDVMAVRQTGCCMLSSASVQEAHDMAAVAHLATLRARLPFVHFFDGFRTSHELNTLVKLTDDQLRDLVPTDLIREHRARALSPENPFIRGTAQNPDTYFQSRETANSYYDAVPGILTEALERFAEISGRQYSLVEYHGHPEADRVVVIMGSGIETMIPVVRHLNESGEKVGVLFVRLYRPFPKEHLLDALPTTVRKIAVLDRTKEPGSGGEPLFLDVSSAVGESVARGDRDVMPVLVGGRSGLSSKEFTPAMAKAVYDELAKDRPRPRFTVGINDDITHLSLEVDPDFQLLDPQTHRAVFYGLGSDGTVGANKNTIKIIGSDPGTYAQGYFVYDSKKSGSRTVSHLRFGPNPIQAPYLVTRSNFIGCHHWSILERVDVLEFAQPGATLLINSPYPADQVWEQLPRPMQDRIVELGISLHVIDASAVARAAGLGSRTNTVLQTCFFAISGVMPREEAIEKVKAAITKTYARKSMAIVQKNHEAVDASLAHLHEVQVPTSATGQRDLIPPVPSDAPSFVREVTATMLAGRGDELPVSALPADGSYPSGTTRYEKRNISEIIAVWDNEACIQCGNCSFVCPHAVLRAKYYPSEVVASAPEGFLSQPIDAAGLPETSYTLQVYAEDCTGCGLCVEACPVKPAGQPNRRAINLEPVLERDKEKEAVKFFETIPLNDRRNVDFGTVRGTQFLEPLFEFSGACAGCGETPYLKLLTQLFGDRVTVANATGCSSIYGGNLPTTPWAKNAQGRGPAWSNSLFEDNAEFGLGLRLAADLHRDMARRLLEELRSEIDDDELIDSLLAAKQRMESGLARQAARVDRLKARLAELEGPKIEDLKSVCDHLLRRSVWIVGGDGWAYDIGYGGLDHVLATGEDVNVLVLDTEVYSNTGGQSSKASRRGSIAQFTAGGKAVQKKDLGQIAMTYGNIFVAQVNSNANQAATLKAIMAAEAYPGPSLIIAYSPCIAHGIKGGMGSSGDQAELASKCGYWPTYTFDPRLAAEGKNPLKISSKEPDWSLYEEFLLNEVRYNALKKIDPEHAGKLYEANKADAMRRYRQLKRLANADFGDEVASAGAASEAAASENV